MVVACCRGGDTEWSRACLGSFEGGHHYLYFGGAPKLLQMVTAAMKLKDAYSLEVRLVKAMVFPAVTYGCESCTVKKAEC